MSEQSDSANAVRLIFPRVVDADHPLDVQWINVEIPDDHPAVRFLLDYEDDSTVDCD